MRPGIRFPDVTSPSAFFIIQAVCVMPARLQTLLDAGISPDSLTQLLAALEDGSEDDGSEDGSEGASEEDFK